MLVFLQLQCGSYITLKTNLVALRQTVYFAFITRLMSCLSYTKLDFMGGFLHFLCVLQVSGKGKVSEEMIANVEFTNPFSFNLENVYIRMEGPGMMEPKSRYYR